jgi:DNA-binding LytR/AlgR family response regulator
MWPRSTRCPFARKSRGSIRGRRVEKRGQRRIGGTTEPEQAVAALAADPPDLCFLDIQMPRLNGFDVLARLSRQPIVIFTTAFDQYALKAFGVNSVDYLLKPVEPEALERALSKVEALHDSNRPSRVDFERLLKQVTDALRQARPTPSITRLPT